MLDRYEQAPGTINVDISEYRPVRPIHLLLSISTIEHVGLDEEQRDPAKALQALWRMRGWIAPDGCLVLTFPLGYHEALDRAVLSGEAGEGFSFLLRTGRCTWRECGPEEVAECRYDRPWLHGNGLAVLEWKAGRA